MRSWPAVTMASSVSGPIWFASSALQLVSLDVLADPENVAQHLRQRRETIGRLHHLPHDIDPAPQIH